jgi:hypothetical protein
MRNIVLVVFPHFVFILPQHDVIALNMIFSYPTLLRHSVEYYVKTPYLVSYCVYMTISQLAVSQSETMNLLNKLYYLLSIFKARFPSLLSACPIAFPNSEVGRELRNEVRKFILKFELRL